MKKNYWLCKTFLLAAIGLSSVAIQGYASSDVLSVAGIEQQKTIQVTGAVEDMNGMPVVGASVVVKGTTNGTVTDMVIVSAKRYHHSGVSGTTVSV